MYQQEHIVLDVSYSGIIVIAALKWWYEGMKLYAMKQVFRESCLWLQSTSTATRQGTNEPSWLLFWNMALCARRQGQRGNLYGDKRKRCVRDATITVETYSSVFVSLSHTQRYCHGAMPSFQRWFKKRLKERFLHSTVPCCYGDTKLSLFILFSFLSSSQWSNHQINMWESLI